VILYLETSNLVKLYVREPGSDEVHKLTESAEIVATSLLSYTEARAAFARTYREKRMPPGAYRSVKEALEEDWSRCFILIPTAGTAKAAGDLAEKHGLRGFDALHLAAALDLRSAAGSEITFSTADDRLKEAARKEGLQTLLKHHT